MSRYNSENFIQIIFPSYFNLLFPSFYKRLSQNTVQITFSSYFPLPIVPLFPLLREFGPSLSSMLFVLKILFFTWYFFQHTISILYIFFCICNVVSSIYPQIFLFSFSCFLCIIFSSTLISFLDTPRSIPFNLPVISDSTNFLALYF